MPGSKDVSLTIFINSMCSNKSLAFFTNRFFQFSEPPDLRLAFEIAKKTEDLAAFSVSEVMRGKRNKQVFLYRRIVKFKVKSKVIPASFLKIEERVTFVGAKDRRKKDG